MTDWIHVKNHRAPTNTRLVELAEELYHTEYSRDHTAVYCCQLCVCPVSNNEHITLRFELVSAIGHLPAGFYTIDITEQLEYLLWRTADSAGHTPLDVVNGEPTDGDGVYILGEFKNKTAMLKFLRSIPTLDHLIEWY